MHDSVLRATFVRAHHARRDVAICVDAMAFGEHEALAARVTADRHALRSVCANRASIVTWRKLCDCPVPAVVVHASVVVVVDEFFVGVRICRLVILVEEEGGIAFLLQVAFDPLHLTGVDLVSREAGWTQVIVFRPLFAARDWAADLLSACRGAGVTRSSMPWSIGPEANERLRCHSPTVPALIAVDPFGLFHARGRELKLGACTVPVAKKTFRSRISEREHRLALKSHVLAVTRSASFMSSAIRYSSGGGRVARSPCMLSRMSPEGADDECRSSRGSVLPSRSIHPR